MSRRVCGTFLLLLVAALPATGVAAELTLADVRASAQSHVPTILRALANNRVAAGERQAANGAFDLVFAADSYNYAGGFYDGLVQTAKATKPLSDFGASVYGQYRVSDGTFPVYQDEFFTNTGGQAKVGVLFSLLRDRDIDQRRFALADAELALRATEFDLLLIRIGLAQRSTIAYWRWVAAGRRLNIYRQLLDNAIARNEGLEREIRQGARAAIFLTENQQNITRRRALVVRAERDLALAAARLGFFRRSADGTMQPPAPSELPADMGALPALAGDSLTSAAQIDDVLARHPQLGALRNAVSRSKLAIALRENALKPRLDVNLEVGHGLGAIAEGGSSRDSTDPIIALSFAVPIERRTARARLEQERNKLSALEFETREAADRMEQALLELGLRRTFARSLFGLATQEVEQLRTLQEAERRRFAAGASDFFLVNVREENTANSEIQLLNAQLDAVVADVNFAAATLDFAALDLAD